MITNSQASNSHTLRIKQGRVMAVQRHQSIALSRLFQIVTLMHGGGRLTQRDLAATCNCSDRQIRRYLKALEAAGVPFTYERKAGYLLDEGWTPFHLLLSLPEVMALLLARQSVVGRAEMPFAHSSQTAFAKIAALLPARLRDQLEEPSVAYYSGGRRNYAEAPWGQLLDAIHRCERLEMDYYTISRDVRSTRRVDPYHIVWLQNYCHLIAYCHERRRVLNFALDGIFALQRTGETFTIPKAFSLAEHLKGAAGPVLGDPVAIDVIFDREMARYAKRRTWEFPHTLSDQPDGTVRLCGMVRGINDMRKELLTWGRHAQVQEPAELRDALLSEAHALVSLYEVAQKIHP